MGTLYILAETLAEAQAIIIDLKHIIIFPFFPPNGSKIAVSIFAINWGLLRNK